MKIVNKTKFSLPLIKRLMRAASVKTSPGKQVTIKITDSLPHLGLFSFIDNDTNYLIEVREDGDTMTLAHEIRHLAQAQREEWYDNESSLMKELDAEFFECWVYDSGIL